ncbi:hypothetical protein COO60DRAFT_1698474 [Scenedesmus sp. NREL 46B-D3]|nr:hypothetical protein COO60DRAFT_1698474 [Scenedesmus sp. NREL 46B-D3]
MEPGQLVPLKPKEAAAAKEQHGRCNDCQSRHEAGQHCCVCSRVWFDYESDRMATCSRCSGRVHEGCDVKAARAVQAAAAAEAAGKVKHDPDAEQQQDKQQQLQQQDGEQVQQQDGGQQQQQQLQVAPYSCPACCRKLAEESRMDLLHLHAVLLADMRPAKPRAAAEIFAAEFARQRLDGGAELDVARLQGLISAAWLEEEAKGKYEQAAAQEAAAYEAALPQYESLFSQYVELAASQRREVDLSLALDPQRLLGPSATCWVQGAHMAAAAPATCWLHHHTTQQGVMRLAAAAAGACSSSCSCQGGTAAAGLCSGSSCGRRGWWLSSSTSSWGWRPSGQQRARVGCGKEVKAEDGSAVPQEIPIMCNFIKGTFRLADMKVVCSCTQCAVLPVDRRTYSPTQYELHAGCGSAKKWKVSLRIEPGAVRECPRGAHPMAFGKWLELKGIEAKGSKTGARQRGAVNREHRVPQPEWAAHILAGPAASVKRHTELLQQQQAAAGVSDAGGPSPCSSSRGVNDGAGGERDAGATSSGGAAQKPAAGVPKNRRPDSWAPWEDVALGQYKPIQVRWAGDRCCVCDSDVDYDCDRLVSCDGCGVTVHQSCYGIPELPEEDDMWLCRACELKEPGAPEPQCCLCPLVGGGLKPTTLPGLWAHAACMQWIPEVTCVEPSRMEPIDRIQHIQKERWELLCCICRQRMGAKIQCNDCYQAYHPLCARRVGLHMEMADPAEPDGPLQLVSHCPKHCTPTPNASGITLLSSDDHIRIGRPRKRHMLHGGSSPAASSGAAAAAASRDPNNHGGLWNAQPFRANRPPAPIPAAPGGCARASGFEAQRIQHGTGTGCTSTAGWWMPTEGTAAAAAAAAAEAAQGAGAGVAEGGGPCDSSTPGLPGLSKPGANRKRKRGGRGSGAGMGPAGGAGAAAAKRAAAKAPPPPVELLPLPDNTPDELQVVCNGKQGTLLLRQQRVLVGGQELTASRFEAMCGKGDAKKWKSSLWVADADGEPQRPMGDFLSERALDKTALNKLAANWAAVEQRRIWEEQQQGQGQGQEQEGDGDVDGGDSVTGEGAATEDGEEVAGAAAEGGGQQQAAESEAMQVDGQAGGGPQQQQAQPAQAAAAATAEDDDEQSGPAAKKRRVSDAGAAADAASNASAAPAAGSRQLAHASSSASSAMASRPEAEQPAAGDHEAAASAAAAEDAAAVAAPEGGSADAAKPSDGVQSAAATAAAAAALRKQQGRVLLQRVPYPQLPDCFALHPAALPEPAAAASIAARKAAADTASPSAAIAAAAAAELAATSPPQGTSSSDPADLELPVGEQPWLAVGRCCRMFWVDDDEWYEADVTGFDPASKQHILWYHLDEVREEINLVEEQKQGRVQWLPLVDKSRWPGKRKLESAAAAAAADDLLLEGLLGAAGFIPWDQQQQQQQQGSGGLDLLGLAHAADAMDAEDEVSDDAADAAAAVQATPPGFPRLTAMHRNLGDSGMVDLLALHHGGSSLQQQLQCMLWQQQQQYATASAAQPPPERTPGGQAAVGWRVGVFWPDVGVYYYGQLVRFDACSGMHVIAYDDAQHDSLHLHQARLDWVAAAGQAASRAARDAHAAYTQQREAALAWQQQKEVRRQQRAALRMQRAAAGHAGGPHSQQQGGTGAMLQLQQQLQQLYAELQQTGWQQGMPVPAPYQQQLRQLAAARQQLAAQSPAAVGRPRAVSPQMQQPMQHLQQQPRRSLESAGEGSAAAPKPPSGPRPDAPKQVDVICGTTTGVFDCIRMVIAATGGGHVSPTEFERLGGKGASKKWKCTIRVRKANGLPGITMGDWLLQMGYDQPKEPRGSASRGSSLNDIRKQQASRKAAAAAAAASGRAGAGPHRGAAAAAGAGGGPGARAGGGAAPLATGGRGVSQHREGCMCVICKQTRRKAAQDAGATLAAHNAHGSGRGGPRRLLGREGPAGKLEERRARLPTMLLGKRAYVHAVPHLVRGAAAHKLWQLPESRSYTAGEWEKQQQGAAAHASASTGAAAAAAASGVSCDAQQPAVSGGEAPAAAAAAAGSRADTPSLSSRPATPLPAAAEPGDEATSSVAIDLQQNLGEQQQQPAGQALQQQQQQQQQQGDKPQRGSRTQSWREKLRVCRDLEPKRITFGKSGIHGWGIFARRPIAQDSMVTEFRGQLVRCILADVRELAYRKQARDCYMFHATDETVIDNTGLGNYSRFTNHCCAPCLYAKPLELGGELHLCFFAKTDIKAGQELTFDYRFKEEDSDSKVICQCGAPTCKGTLN